MIYCPLPSFQEDKLKIAILDYLKRFHPKDNDNYTMVALNFTMYREIAHMLEENGRRNIELLKDKPLGLCLYKIYTNRINTAELYLCPYPPKVQARPPRDLRPAPWSRVSGQGWAYTVKCYLFNTRNWFNYCLFKIGDSLFAFILNQDNIPFSLVIEMFSLSSKNFILH